VAGTVRRPCHFCFLALLPLNSPSAGRSSIERFASEPRGFQPGIFSGANRKK
jgi:hypothetical protein